MMPRPKLHKDELVRRAQEHFRNRFGQDVDVNDATDRELIAASVHEVAEEVFGRGRIRVSWVMRGGRIQLAVRALRRGE